MRKLYGTSCAGVLVALAVAWCVTAPADARAPKFFPDDPIWVDDDTAIDAQGVEEIEDSNGYDFVINTFANPGERRNVRALNVNTVDEVPDSSWFVNRIGRREMSIAEIVRGPDQFEEVSLDGWVVSAGKPTGAQPGFRMTTPSGELYQIEFDPPSNPEMATGAEVIGTAFYHAMGYYTVEAYLADLDPAELVIGDDARVFDPLIGEKRRLTRRDIEDVLRRGARRPDGTYRVLASRFAPGASLGNFRYYGTRPDDPNDIFPHEHRRELRGARVFGAWLNHDDSRGVNSLDRLIEENGRHYVRHYMFDFGSIMGSGTRFSQRHRAGNEYILEWKPGWLVLATLGLYTRPWERITYPPVPPSVGRFEGDAFEPDEWKPEYPNPAFDNMREDDAFWAARIVARFSDEAIRAIVAKARYSDRRASDYLVETLIKRRDKVLRRWLTGVNPLVDFALSPTGELTFANAAVQARVATPAGEYRLTWSRFDNATGEATPAGEPVAAPEGRIRAPEALLSSGVPFIQVDIGAVHPSHPAWALPVRVHFRRAGDRWELVGVERGVE